MAILSEIFFTHEGKRLSALAWCRELGIDRRKIHSRIERFGTDAGFDKLFFKGSFEKRNLITYKGKTLNATEWDRLFGYRADSVARYIKRGWTMEEVERGHRSDSITYHSVTRNGITDTLRGWSIRQGIKYPTVLQRIHKLGWTQDEALGFVKHKNKSEKIFKYRNESHSYVGWARKLDTSVEMFSKRVKAYEDGLITKAEVVHVDACRYANLKSRVWWKGRRYSIKEIVAISELGKSTFYDRLRKGWSIAKIMSTPPTDTGYSARIRKRRITELKKIGIMV